MKKEIPEDAYNSLEELIQFVYNASVYWQSYWCLDSVDAWKRYVDVFREHEWWYATTRKSYSLGAIISLAKFFETNNHTMNIWLFTKQLERYPEWSSEAAEIRSLLKASEIEIRDIALLRSNYYAHQNKDLTIREIFDKISLSYDEIPRVIQRMADMLNVVVASVGGNQANPSAIAERTEEEINIVLRKLESQK